MARRTKHKLPTVLRAIKGSHGIKKLIAKRLKVSRSTLDGYLQRWKSARYALEAEVEGLLDDAELVVIDDVIDKKNVKTAKWLLGTRGACRGYIKPAPAPPQKVDGEEIKEVKWADPGPRLPIEDAEDARWRPLLDELGIKPEDVGLNHRELEREERADQKDGEPVDSTGKGENETGTSGG